MASILKVDEIQATDGGSLSVQNHHIQISKSSNQNLTNNTRAKVTTWTEDLASGLSWDSSNNRIDVAAAGHYFVNYQLQAFTSGNDIRDIILNVEKNGSTSFGTYGFIGINPSENDIRHFTVNCSSIISCSAGDYLEFYVTVQTGSSSPLVFDGDSTGGEKATGVQMFRVGGA